MRKGGRKQGIRREGLVGMCHLHFKCLVMEQAQHQVVTKFRPSDMDRCDLKKSEIMWHFQGRLCDKIGLLWEG